MKLTEGQLRQINNIVQEELVGVSNIKREQHRLLRRSRLNEMRPNENRVDDEMMHDVVKSAVMDATFKEISAFTEKLMYAICRTVSTEMNKHGIGGDEATHISPDDVGEMLTIMSDTGEPEADLHYHIESAVKEFAIEAVAAVLTAMHESDAPGSREK